MSILRYKLSHEQRIAQVAAAVVGSAVVGGAMSSSASKKASNAQSAAAAQADETQRYQFDETNRLNAPFRNTGVAANNLLANYIGLPGYENGTPQSVIPYITKAAGDEYDKGFRSDQESRQQAIDSAIEKYRQGGYGSDAETLKAFGYVAPEGSAPNATFGSLLKNFGQDDLNRDVIYQNTHQYAQDQGNLGVNRLAAASGSQLSGATLKALQKSGANIANQYGNDAFNRSNVEKTNMYNRLAGVSGSGQQATNQIASAGQNMANNISNNQIGVGNARGASAIAQGNAWGNALSTGANAYQQQGYMNSLNNFGSGSGGYGDEMARLNSQAGGY